MGARRRGWPKFRAFFPLPPIFDLLTSFGVWVCLPHPSPSPLARVRFFCFLFLRGCLLVEFWWCLKRRDPQMCTFPLSSLPKPQTSLGFGGGRGGGGEGVYLLLPKLETSLGFASLTPLPLPWPGSDFFFFFLVIFSFSFLFFFFCFVFCFCFFVFFLGFEFGEVGYPSSPPNPNSSAASSDGSNHALQDQKR